MKISRVLLALAAVPAGVVALGAVALGVWTLRRNVSPPSSTANAAESPTIAGSPEEVASVAEAMAEEGGAVLMTEVTPIGEGDTLVTKTLLIAELMQREAKS